MTGLVTALVALAGAVLLLGLLVSVVLGRRKRAAAAARRNAPSARGSVPAEPRRPEVRIAVAEPGVRGPLFQYGGDGPGFEVDAPFAVVHVATTGFSPAKGDRIVEIAIARVDDSGRVHDEYATLVDPGRDVGPVFVHGISTSEVRGAPTFADIAGEILDRMDGAVVVMHDGAFVERFLAAEFARAGVQLPLAPALCSAWLARRTLRTPDHTLRTLSRHAGRTTLDTTAALAAVRTIAALLPQMLAVHGQPLRYLCGLRPMPELDIDLPPTTRPVEVRESTDGWMASLMARRRLPTAAAGEIDAQRYLDTVTEALADSRLLGGEAQTLTRLGASAGLGAAQVDALHGRLVEHLRAAALSDVILTTGQIRQLRTAASALGLSTYFDELRPTSPQDLVASRAMPAPRDVRLCTHCRRPGHDRAGCPELASLSV
ncbi:exonuclease domain-containing protein [Blastococcus sp. CT_GayMR16]|uniref:3'-5' exonuclease n=1 Tax=Blastococcus sp. CT_GayMR16 TaxID=2559607 RepID=UPI001430CD21|nr:exonuclease domain-containing protein [Blastococcus sp. CT_GayMR16]